MYAAVSAVLSTSDVRRRNPTVSTFAKEIALDDDHRHPRRLGFSSRPKSHLKNPAIVQHRRGPTISRPIPIAVDIQPFCSVRSRHRLLNHLGARLTDELRHLPGKLFCGDILAENHARDADRNDRDRGEGKQRVELTLRSA